MDKKCNEIFWLDILLWGIIIGLSGTLLFVFIDVYTSLNMNINVYNTLTLLFGLTAFISYASFWGYMLHLSKKFIGGLSIERAAIIFIPLFVIFFYRII